MLIWLFSDGVLNKEAEVLPPIPVFDVVPRLKSGFVEFSAPIKSGSSNIERNSFNELNSDPACSEKKKGC